ncbi:MAG: ABC transporter ATP-binding protein [Planctomycetes bacterium]|nr:ABC transporter ATP-binding protein [Planctomycetota bacterium]
MSNDRPPVVAVGEPSSAGSGGPAVASGGPSEPPAPVIEATRLGKTYRDFWGRRRIHALSGLTLEVRPGEIFGLLGPNGSGKTTSIKLLLGLIAPTAGVARVFGRPPADVSSKARIGYLPEESYLYRFLTGEQTLRFFGRLAGLSGTEITKQTGALLDQVGISSEARRRKLSEYSKGMVRRVGIAQALIGSPELLFLDEPTSGLDPLGMAEVKELIVGLRARGKTIVLSSHLLADVEDICDRVAILHRGRLARLGAVAELTEAGDRVELRVTGAAGVDDPRVVAAAAGLRAAGLSVEAVRKARISLEAAFVRIIREQDAPEP